MTSYLGSRMTLNDLVFIKIQHLGPQWDSPLLNFVGEVDNPVTLTEIVENRRTYERKHPNAEFWPISKILEMLVPLLQFNAIKAVSLRKDVMSMELRWKIWNDIRGNDP